ncbi:TetR/AcrR family transcriptional regulator C-terminal domain-containing protein [Embleya sp. NPDC050493]|uniref:TetR/AcrR family transcriptional regulator C-terminal domain-containing protein n=1 Tax=Embleya sp. NPDC050493 TaxID=3363989 RepID=UPI003790C098
MRTVYVSMAYKIPTAHTLTKSFISRGISARTRPALEFRHASGPVTKRRIRAITAYTQGVAMTLVDEIEAEQRSGLTTAQWRKTAGSSWDSLFESGAYPRLTRAMRTAGEPWDLDALFRSGLAGVPDGIATLVRQGEPG